MSEISIVLLSALVVSVAKTDKCSLDEIKQSTRVAESLLFVRLSKAAHDQSSWPSGLRSQRIWIDSRVRKYFQCVFSFFFSILMLNCFKLVKWHHQIDEMVIPGLFILNYAWNLWGWVKFGPAKEN